MHSPRQGRASPAGHPGKATMSCRDTIHLICWYLEGKLSPSVQSEIEKHLSECHDCHVVLDAANSTLDHYFGPGRVPETNSTTPAPRKRLALSTLSPITQTQES